MSDERDPDPLVRPVADFSPVSAGSGSGGEGMTGPGRTGADPDAARRRRQRREASENMLPQRERRPLPERLLVRLVATCGIVGIGVAIAAIMVSSNDQGWIVGLVVSIVNVVLAAILWSSRML